MNLGPFSKTFLELVREQEGSELSAILDLAQEAELCYPISGAPHRAGFRFRAARRARLVATRLIDKKGELDKEILSRLLQLAEQAGHIFYPEGTSDARFMQRFWSVLKKLAFDKSLQALLKKFYAPVCHRGAEQLIRETLLLKPEEVLSDADVKRAVLASVLSSLRQNVGSCFATAPAILVHEEQLHTFLTDLYELLTTGRLKRTIRGQELIVPLSLSWGGGDVRKKTLLFDPESQIDCSLLKAWEFTIASFCDVKMEFSKWNLYASLGLNPEESGGIGECIYLGLSEKLAEYNKQIQRATEDYELAFDQLRMAEGLLRQASSEREARTRKAEHHARLYHMQACLDKRDEIHARAEMLTQLFPFLLKQYEEQFPLYFQEVYDPEMRGFKASEHEDAPAGFRLVYKQGRNDPLFWTWIHNPDQYTDSLVHFFRQVENEIHALCKTDAEKEEFVRISTALAFHVRTPEFLESALVRMAREHHTPLNTNEPIDWEKIDKKPWAYTSGGTMNTLLKSYFRREGEISEELKRVESAVELAIFLIDGIKHLSAQLTDPYLKDPEKGMLIQSPTHAFILHPGWELLKEAWQDDIYTYTWVRDNLVLPGKEFYEKMELSAKEQEHLVDAFADKLPLDLAHLLRRGFLTDKNRLTPLEFRERLLDEFRSLLALQGKEADASLADAIDSFLHESLPLVEGRDWKEKAKELLGDLVTQEIQTVLEEASAYPAAFLSSLEIQEAAKACYVLAQKSILIPLDLHAHIAKRARHLELALPAPFLFADTNWECSSFALLVNPGTSILELWRVDPLALTGAPMSSWNPYITGQTKRPWVIYPRPFEYTL